MKIPKTFLPENKNLEEHIRKLIQEPRLKIHNPDFDDVFPNLDKILKNALTSEEKETFLGSFVEHIPYLIGKVRKKMEEKRGLSPNMYIIYLDDPADYKNRGYGYRTRFEIRSDDHFYFVHYISGNGYESDLDDDLDLETIYDYLSTYPDEGGEYSTLGGADFLERSFKQGKEMYESMKLFLEENKNL